MLKTNQYFFAFSVIFFFIYKIALGISPTKDNIQTEWVKTYSGIYSDITRSALLTSGNSLIHLGNSYSFSPNPEVTAPLIVATTAYGDIIWQKSIYSEQSYATSIVEDDDNGFVFCGAISGGDYSDCGTAITPLNDLWISKIGSDGSALWSKAYSDHDPNRDEYALNVFTRDDQIKYVLFGFSSVLDHNCVKSITSSRLKIGNGGTVLSRKNFSDVSSSSSSLKFESAIETSDDAYLTVAHRFIGSILNPPDLSIIKVRIGVGVEWARAINFEGVTILDAGSAIELNNQYIITGHLYNDSTQSWDLFIVTTTKEGAILSATGIGTRENNELFASVTGSSNQIVIGATTIDRQRTGGYILLVLDENILPLIQKQYLGLGGAAASAIKIAHEGFLLSGNTNIHGSETSDDMLAIKTDPEGDIKLYWQSKVTIRSLQLEFYNLIPVEKQIIVISEEVDTDVRDVDIEAIDTDLMVREP